MGAESPSPNVRVAITIYVAASYAFLLVPYSRELPRGDDPSDAPASTFSSLSGPPKGANKGCQPRSSSVGTLWGLSGHEAGPPKASRAITIYVPRPYVHRTRRLPDTAAQDATSECQSRPPGFGTLCRLGSPRPAAVHGPLATAHCGDGWRVGCLDDCQTFIHSSDHPFLPPDSTHRRRGTRALCASRFLPTITLTLPMSVCS